MERRRSFWTAVGCYFFIGTVLCVEIALENSMDGYFLRSPYNKYKAYDPNLEKETFFITNTDESPLIRASYGPFEVYQSVPSMLLSGSKSNRTKSSHHAITYNMDVSIHVILWPIGPDQNTLRVLIHASPLWSNRRTSALFDYAASKDPSQQWCARVFLQHSMYELSTVCVFSEQKKACVADIMVPAEWWTSNVTAVDILYSVTRVDEGYQCASASNFILPDRTFGRKKERIYFTRMSLSVPLQSYQEKKDHFVLLYVPTKAFRPGTKFDIPVKLEAEANLKVFTIKVKARSGIKILSAEISSRSRWTINVDINTKQRSAVVKAYVKDKSQYTKTPWVQDIFRWRFEVDQDIPSHSQSGRVIWNIEYETVSVAKSDLSPSRIVSYISLDAAPVQMNVIPVLKVNQIINTAVLTGKHQVYALSIYAVSHNRSVVEITDGTLCYSSDETVLKVSTDCRNVYVDGSETAGSRNVSVIAKYAEHTVYQQVSVWVPEPRLDIQLSDNKLSQVKEWRAPRHGHHRNHRGSGKAGGKDEDSGRCSLRYQQAMLEIYTRFMVPVEDQAVYYGNNKAYFRVTELVKGRIRVSDPRIAELSPDIVVRGKQPGRTEIQVLSPAGRVIAAKEIKVGKDKVMLDSLLVTMVTGISLEIKESKHVSGALTATAHIHDQLQGKYPEGVLNVMLKYTDGTVFPLKYVQPEDYHLDVVALNHRIIGIAPYVTPHQPRVKALSQGKGKLLKVLLRIGNACHKKRSHPLGVAFAYVNIDMNLDKNYLERYQNDGGHHNRASDRWQAKVTRDQLKQSMGARAGNSDDVVLLPKNRANRTKITADDVFQRYHIQDDLAKMLGEKGDMESSTEPRTEAQLQSVPISKAMTPLEIGMYVLLAIFCLAIVVLVINCVIFVFRYRRKQVPKVNKDLVTNANDWVWIGRATLERNAVKMRSPHALMTDSDFNGNHQRESSPLQGESDSDRSSAPNSNRNSTSSTYKGSECSIRITNNPMDQSRAGMPNIPLSQASCSFKTGHAGREPEWDYEAMGMTYEQLMDYFDNLKESSA